MDYAQEANIWTLQCTYVLKIHGICTKVLIVSF